MKTFFLIYLTISSVASIFLGILNFIYGEVVQGIIWFVWVGFLAYMLFWQGFKSFFKKKESEKYFAKKKNVEDELLTQLGYEGMNVEELIKEGYRRNFKNGVYVRNESAPLGTIDNPKEIGEKGFCTFLYFKVDYGGFVLSDSIENTVR